MVIWEPYVDYSKIRFKPLSRKQGQGHFTNFTYADCIAAFDIETTRIPEIEQSFMYVWQFALGDRFVIMGRTWKEFLHMMKELKRRLYGLRLMVFVHNLSYEFQFLSSPSVYQFDNEEVFITDSRSILRCFMMNKAFEFRCSARLFNMSLKAVTKKFNCQYAKESGEAFQYDKIRTPKTSLSHREIYYCVCDVLGLIEAIKHQLALHDDNLYSLPYTSTAYVRREAKRAMRPAHAQIQRAFPDLELYKTLQLAFRGGNTHANRFFNAINMEEPIKGVHGIDISSSYPTQQVLELFPVSPFKKIGVYSLTALHMRDLIDRGEALLMVVDFTDIKLKYQYEPIPYIARAKILSSFHKPDLWVDNGRVLDSHGITIRLAITDIDFKIIESQYTWHRMEIVQMWSSHYGPMFDGLRDLNIRLFKEKTTLKNVAGQELYYARSKEQLNGIYGMSVSQADMKGSILLSDPKTDGYTMDFVPDTSMTDEELHAKAKKNAFTLFQLGVWTTAHARAELQAAIDLDKDNTIYCDTDSVMFIGDRPGLDELNRSYIERCTVAGAFADDPKGKRHYLGVFENEDDSRTGYKYERFATLGAKKYAFEKLDKNGKLYVGITVAGVPKKKGAEELARKGGLEAFKPNFVFNETGKLMTVYNDDEYGNYEINGEIVYISRNVCLAPTTYALGLSDDYKTLLDRINSEKLDKIIEKVQF